MVTTGTTAQLYLAGDELPHRPRRLTLKRKTADFTLTLMYDAASTRILPEGEDRVIGRFTIRVPPSKNPEAPVPDVRITFNIDRNK